jgi:TonB family protein
MKHLLILVFTTFTILANSQSTLTIYYDSNWVEVPQQKANYYRIATKVGEKLWSVNDYFLNGKIQMTGNYQSRKFKNKEGQFTYYYENGQKSSEGKYLNNNRTGYWVSYYEDGNKSQEETYLYGKLNGECTTYYKSDRIESEGSFLNGNYDGEWKWYFENGNMSTKETYANNELIDIECWTENNVKQEENCFPEKESEFEGGFSAMTKFIQENINYPKKAIRDGIKGKVYVLFSVDIDGSLGDFEIVKSVHPLLDQEALRVVKLLPDFIPAVSHNRIVKSYFRMPFDFDFTR